MNESAKNVAYYLTLPYTTVLVRDDDEDKDIIARIEELPGCIAHGSDEARAIENLREMQRLWADVFPELASAACPNGEARERQPESIGHRMPVRRFAREAAPPGSHGYPESSAHLSRWSPSERKTKKKRLKWRQFDV
jgi:predicted RNase H-like HicB family nuclease